MAAAMVSHEFPPVLGPGECSQCASCNAASICALAHCAREAGTAASFGDETAFETNAAALLADRDGARREYLRKWDGLVMCEEDFCRHGAAGDGEGEMPASKKEVQPFWMTASAEADSAGTCFARMRYASVRDVGVMAGADRFTYRFVRERGWRSLENGYEIKVGDNVDLSTESVFSVASGRIFRIAAQELDVTSRQRIKPPGYAHASHFALGGEEDAALRRIAWRIDLKESQFSQCRIARINLYRLFSNSPHDNNLVRRIVDKVAPVFGAPPVLSPKLVEHLNSKQRAALQHVLAAEDYSLVLGMPGTGKSELITVLIEHCLAFKQSVLVSAHTNSAVDNVLLRLKKRGIRFLRLGNSESVHAEVQPYTLDALLPVASRTVRAVDELMRSVSVVGVTCISASSQKLLDCMTKSFELCIVDEASQVRLAPNHTCTLAHRPTHLCARAARAQTLARKHLRQLCSGYVFRPQ
jgi:hypothetical protein